MRLWHTAGVEASFDDQNLISHAGLEPVMRLAASAGWPGWSPARTASTTWTGCATAA